MERAKNIFDKIGSLIPGYRGYAEREGRRQCDKLLREEIISVIAKCEEDIGSQLDEDIKVKDKDVEKIKSLENNRKRINTLASKIKFSPYGISAFFSNSQLKETELEQIYKKDLAILESVNSLKSYIKQKAHKEILLEIANIEDILEERNKFIKEFK